MQDFVRVDIELLRSDLENSASWFSGSDFAGYNNVFERAADIQTLKNPIQTPIEILNYPKTHGEALKLGENSRDVREDLPDARKREAFVHARKIAIERLD